MRFLVRRIKQVHRVRLLFGQVLDADAHVGCEGVLIIRGSSRVFRCKTEPGAKPLWIPVSHGEIEEILQSLSVPARYRPAISAEVIRA